MNTTSALCLSEEANVAAKHKFRAALLKAIAKNDVQAFKSCVEQIGKDWGVCRNVETVNKDAFGEALWNKREAILSGAYDGWENSKYSAYSYESKVCFLLNPLHYKVIYDSRTKEALNESDRGKCRNGLSGTIVKHYGLRPKTIRISTGFLGKIISFGQERAKSCGYAEATGALSISWELRQKRHGSYRCKANGQQRTAVFCCKNNNGIQEEIKHE